MHLSVQNNETKIIQRNTHSTNTDLLFQERFFQSRCCWRGVRLRWRSKRSLGGLRGTRGLFRLLIEFILIGWGATLLDLFLFLFRRGDTGIRGGIGAIFRSGKLLVVFDIENESEASQVVQGVEESECLQRWQEAREDIRGRERSRTRWWLHNPVQPWRTRIQKREGGIHRDSSSHRVGGRSNIVQRWLLRWAPRWCLFIARDGSGIRGGCSIAQPDPSNPGVTEKRSVLLNNPQHWISF